MSKTYLLVVREQGCSDPALKGLFVSDAGAQLAFKAMFKAENVIEAWIYQQTCGPARRFEVVLWWEQGEWR